MNLLPVPQKSILALLSLIVLDVVSYQVVLPMMPALLAHFHLDSDWAHGIGISAYTFAVLWGAPWIGSLSDRWGRKRILKICLWGQVLSGCLMIAAIRWTAFPILLLSRLLYGLFANSNVPVIQAIFIDWSQGSSQTRSRYLSLIALALTLGLAIGPAIGGLFTDHQPPLLTLPFVLLISAALVLNGILSRIEFPPPVATSGSAHPSPIWKHIPTLIQPVFWILSAFFLFEIAWTSYYLTLPIHLDESLHLTPKSIGLWSGCVGIAMGAALLVYPLWNQRISAQSQAIGGLLVMAILVFSTTGLNTFAGFLLTGALIAWAVPVAYVSLINRIAQDAIPTHYGITMGLAQTLISLAWTLSASFSKLSYHVHPHLPFFIAAAVLLLAILLWRAQRSCTPLNTSSSSS